MIDIIIPAYNAHATIIQTLSTIAIQTMRDKCIVYIVDDCSTKNYDEEIYKFKDILNIKQLRTEKNSGAGYARQYGIDHSTSPYIIFIDADDLFYDCFSIKNLYKGIVNTDYNLVVASYVNEQENKTTIVGGNSVFGCLHGKIFRRKYLEENNIRFNKTRYSEDNSFCGLVANTTHLVKIINDIVYVYKYSNDSLTSNLSKLPIIHTSYLYNMLWLSKQLAKRNADQSTINLVMLNSYFYIYHEILEHEDIDFNYMYTHCYAFEKYFEKIMKNITPDEFIPTFMKHFQGDISYIKTMISNFLIFRTNFKKLGDSND